MPVAIPAPKSALKRSGIAVLLLAVEYVALFLLLAQLFDGAQIAELPAYWRAAVWGATYAFGGGILGLCAAVLFWGDRLARDFAAVRMPDRLSEKWLVVHGLSLALLAGLSVLMLGRPGVAEQGGVALLALWLAAGLGVVFALFRAIFRGRLFELAWRLRDVVLGSALFGAMAGILLSHIVASWQLLAGPTLSLSVLLLSPFFDQIYAAPAEDLLGLGTFVVHVSKTCSGIEGIALITLFLSGFLYRFRDEYRFPRALLLLPAAILVSFLANGARIALLVVIGAYVSPEIASGAFHSMAGWIFFCLLTIGFAALARRIPWLRRDPRAMVVGEGENPTATYLTPFLLWLGLGMVASTMILELDAFYPARVLVVGGLLMLQHRRYAEHFRAGPATARRTDALAPWAIGIAIFLGWLALSPTAEPARSLAEVRTAAGWSSGFFLFWIACRLIGTVVIVPIIEELAFRGYLQRRFTSPDFTSVPIGAWHWLPVLASAAVFGALHGNWIAGILAGVAFSYAVTRRGRLSDAMIAHGVANLLLSVWVLGLGRWDLW
jgi:exosortase E/protease (VPEID-CTERM system)